MKNTHRKLRLLILLLLGGYSLSAMELNTVDINKNQVTEIDIAKMWGQLNNELHREDKNALKVFDLFMRAKVLAEVDKPFLTDHQYKSWKEKLNGVLILISDGNKDCIMDEQTIYQHQKFALKFKDLVHPKIKYYGSKLEIIKWADRYLEIPGWSAAWPAKIGLEKSESESLLVFKDDQIKVLRKLTLQEKEYKIGKKFNAALAARPSQKFDMDPVCDIQ